MFKQIGSETDTFLNKFALLKKSFADINRDLQSGFRMRSFTSIVTETDIKNLNDFNNAINKGTSYTQAYNTYISKSPVIIKKQALELSKLYHQQNLLNRQKREGKITQEQYSTALQANKAQIKALTTQTQGFTLAQKIATKVTNAFRIALNMIGNIAIMAAINLIITGITSLVNAYGNAIEKTKEFTENINDSKEKIASLNDELATNKKRLRELEQIKYPTLVQQDEIDKLKEQNALLEKQIQLEELKLRQEINKADNEARGAYGWLKTKHDRVPYLGNTSSYTEFGYSNLSANEAWLNRYEKLINRKKDLDDKYDNGQLNIEEYNNELQKLEEDIEWYYNDLYQVYDQYQTIMLGLNLDRTDSKEIYEELKQFTDRFEELAYSKDNTAKTFTDVINDAKFTDVVEELKRLAKAGELTEKTFNNVEGIEEFKEALLDISNVVGEDGVLDPSDIANIIYTFKTLATASEEGSDGVTDFTDSLSEFKETCKTAFDSQSKIQSAFDKIKEGGVLTADEVRNLIDTLSEVYPEISTLFTKVGDGYTISLEDLVSANDAVTGELKSSIENRIAELENTRKKAETLVASPIAKETIKSTTTEIKSLTTVLSMLGLTVESSDDKPKQLAETYKELSIATSTLVGKAKTVSSAFAEQNENGKLSAETVLSLIENGYATALMYDKETGAIRLNAQAYLELANAEIEQQRIELEIAKETALQDKLDAEREIVSNLGWSYLGAAEAAVEWEKVQKRIADDNADVSKYDAMLASLMDFKGNLGDIINGNYGNTGGNTEDLNKKLFEQEKALRQHWLAMGKDDKGKKYTEDMYYAWLDSADGYKKYFSDLEKYLDENRQYEEEVYKWKLERDKQFFQEKLDNYNKLADTELNDKEYDDPLQKYRNAATIIGEAITATQNRINNLVATGSSAVQDEIDDLTDRLGDLNERLAEINDDLWDTRVDNEKEFWEQQKEAVQSYYDNEIKKLQDIEDEQEKINKQEELRLNLIKAQQELLDAKKNRNQLVFHNGTFEYMYDQEKVESAQENLKNAQDDIAKNQRQESIKLLEEQRDNAIEFYDKILNMIEAYINKTLPVEASDPEVLENILNSEYAKAANQETTINNPTSDIKNATKNFKAITLDEFISRLGVTKAQWDKFSESMNIVSGISNMRNSDLLEKVVTNNSYVNSNSNQNSVSVGDIHVTVQGGTSETMINEFAEKLRSKLVTLGIRTQVN